MWVKIPLDFDFADISHSPVDRLGVSPIPSQRDGERKLKKE
jgi:hypothetical protein